MTTNLFTVLGQERSAGESYGRYLHAHGRADPNTYAQGILLYAEAKAAFDGLIEAAKGYLTEDIALAEVPGLDLQVQAAVSRRTAFTDHVTEQLLVDTTGTRFGIGDILKPEALLTELIAGLRGLWQDYRASQDSRRKALWQQLDALKWRPFHELTGG